MVWHKISDKLSLKSMLKALVIAMNAHLALNNSNQIAVIASHSDGSRFLYPAKTKQDSEEETAPKMKTRERDLAAEEEAGYESRSISPETESSSTKFVNSSMYRQFKVVDESFLENLYTLLNEPIPTKPPKNSLSSSLSLALTYINKVQTVNTVMKARVLVVNISQDEHLKYIPIMNCIFAAQKMKVGIDVCQLGTDATFLQQASDATNGVYLHVENLEGLIQYFTVSQFSFIYRENITNILDCLVH